MTREPFDHLLDKLDWKPTGKTSDGTGRPWATHEGYLLFEGYELKVYILNTGQKVFDAKSCEGILGMTVPEMFNRVGRVRRA